MSFMPSYSAPRRKSVRAVTVKAAPREINTADVFAAACAAQRINGEYAKETYCKYENNQWYRADGSEAPYTRITANKILIRELLDARAAEVTDVDRAEAEAVRGYWQLKLFAVLSGDATGYIKSAVEAASADTVVDTDFMRLGLISSLPQGYERGMVRDQRDEVKQEVKMTSQHIGTIGATVSGKVEIIDCVWSKNYECFYVTGNMEGNMVLFIYKSKLDAGKQFQLRGKVKKHRDDNVTQLNYVKLT